MTLLEEIVEIVVLFIIIIAIYKDIRPNAKIIRTSYFRMFILFVGTTLLIPIIYYIAIDASVILWLKVFFIILLLLVLFLTIKVLFTSQNRILVREKSITMKSLQKDCIITVDEITQLTIDVNRFWNQCEILIQTNYSTEKMKIHSMPKKITENVFHTISSIMGTPSQQHTKTSWIWSY